MKPADPINTVFFDFGLALFNDSKNTMPVESLSKTKVMGLFAGELFDPTLKSESGYSRETYLEDFLAYAFTDKFVCKIVDYDKWLRAFCIDPSQIPFPRTYMESFRFIFFEPDGSFSNLVLPYSNAHFVAKSTGKTEAEVFDEIFPQHRLTKLFDEKKAFSDSRSAIQGVIELLDELPDKNRTTQFKKALFNATLKCLQQSFKEQCVSFETAP